jgi:putative acetyltransferase
VIATRPEASEDRAAVYEVLSRAFPSDAEARLVEALRGRTEPQVSLVAEQAQRVIGHILFTPVEIRSRSERSRAIGLGPMAVLPEHQRHGAGSALVRAGLAACAAVGERVVVVLGHPDYYPRFGFQPAWDFGLYYQSPGANPAFMVCELARGALRGRAGQVVYHAAFEEVEHAD